MYIYYDRRCDERDVTVGAWILGRKPDVYADHGLDKAPRVGCWNNALIKSSDFAVPVGPQKWDPARNYTVALLPDSFRSHAARVPPLATHVPMACLPVLLPWVAQ